MTNEKVEAVISKFLYSSDPASIDAFIVTFNSFTIEEKIYALNYLGDERINFDKGPKDMQRILDNVVPFLRSVNVSLSRATIYFIDACFPSYPLVKDDNKELERLVNSRD